MYSYNNNVIRLLLNCPSLSLVGGDFRISKQYKKEYINISEQLVDPSTGEDITDIYVSFTGIVFVTYEPIDKNYLPGSLPAVSEGNPVMRSDLDNKTLVYDGINVHTQIGGWLETQPGFTIDTPLMPFVSDVTYPEYLVSVANGTITQEELEAQVSE